MFRRCGRVVLMMVAASVGVQAQTRHSATDEVRALYYAAAYEQALLELDRVEVTNTSEAATVELFRGASLFALGRSSEAERAFERLVTVKPDLLPDELGMTPWITSRFAAVRARVLAEMEQQNRAKNPPQGEPEVPPDPPGLDTAPEFYTLADESVSRPIPIREHVPEPPAIKGADFSGTITLVVDIAIDGTVERVSVEGTIHRRVDAMIRQAAGTWLYRPATLDGHPVKFRKALKIEIGLTRGHTDCCTAALCEPVPILWPFPSASLSSCPTDAPVVTTR
jgi:hypothetical protein